MGHWVEASSSSTGLAHPSLPERQWMGRVPGIRTSRRDIKWHWPNPAYVAVDGTLGGGFIVHHGAGAPLPTRAVRFRTYRRVCGRTFHRLDTLCMGHGRLQRPLWGWRTPPYQSTCVLSLPLRVPVAGLVDLVACRFIGVQTSIMRRSALRRSTARRLSWRKIDQHALSTASVRLIWPLQ